MHCHQGSNRYLPFTRLSALTYHRPEVSVINQYLPICIICTNNCHWAVLVIHHEVSLIYLDISAIEAEPQQNVCLRSIWSICKKVWGFFSSQYCELCFGDNLRQGFCNWQYNDVITSQEHNWGWWVWHTPLLCCGWIIPFDTYSWGEVQRFSVHLFPIYCFLFNMK